jgi:hypothetical protein
MIWHDLFTAYITGFVAIGIDHVLDCRSLFRPNPFTETLLVATFWPIVLLYGIVIATREGGGK